MLGLFVFRGAKYTTMTDISFKEWLRESERTDEGILGRIGGAAKAAIDNMYRQTVRGGLNTVGGVANSALGVGQALIPGQHMAGAKRVGRGLLQAGKGVGQVALGGAPALAAAAGMPGADLAVGALAPHIGAAAAGMVPAAIQGIGSTVPAITPLAAAGQHLVQGDGPAAAKGSYERDFGLQGWRTGGKTSVSSVGSFPSKEAAVAKYLSLIKRVEKGEQLTDLERNTLATLDKRAVAEKWGTIHGPNGQTKPGGYQNTSKWETVPDDQKMTAPRRGPSRAMPPPMNAPTPGTGRHTKDMTTGEIRAEMERRQKSGDTKTAEKLAYVLKKRAEKSMTAPEGLPPEMKRDWDEYTKLLSSKDPEQIALAQEMFMKLNRKYRNYRINGQLIKWPMHKSWTDT